MTKFSAVVVDDERLARKELIMMLKDYKNINVVAEADSVDSALEVIKKHLPDIIFLDIQMPGKSGFDLLESLNANIKVIFVTAFDEYAIKAFEINALDYLLKPINPDRLRSSIDRLNNEIVDAPNTVKILSNNDHLLLNVNNKIQFIKICTIIVINSAGDYSKITTTNGENGLTHKSMKEWESRLPDSKFCRIHRSSIVNIEKVNNIEQWYNNSYLVTLEGIKDPIIMSRRYFSKIKEKLG